MRHTRRIKILIDVAKFSELSGAIKCTIILARDMVSLGAMEIASGSTNPVLKSEYCLFSRLGCRLF